MLKTNKLALLVLTFLSIHPLVHLSAQQRTFSALSRFGLGESQTIGYSSSSAMGRTGIGVRSSYGINNFNPASLSALDSLSFYFDGGMSYFWQSQETQDGNIENSDMVFDYIALAFSVSPRVTSSVGFKPISGTGYKFLTTDEQINSQSELNGSGNLTQAYFSLAVKPIENLSVGASFGYLFGNLRNISKAEFLGSTLALNHGIYNEVRISSIVYDFGAQYTHLLDDARSLTLGVTFRPKIGLKGDATSYIARGSIFGDDNNLFYPGSTVDTLRHHNKSLDNNEIEYAGSYGFGFSYNIKNKLTVAADYSAELWSDAKHFDKTFSYKNTTKYSVGAEYIPNDRSAKSYLARVRYRAGAYARDENIGSYRDVNNNVINSDLKNYGITFGLGLPLKRSKTSINLAVEFGKRDANGSNNYKQSYGKITANFSIHELWFYKRQFD
ncbi:OmpP1/FadL family transporter [Saccharicrinis sp. 156]|uniref:OmpP1/FadL family transporter n=1 Tax=Saccharicrinis sp. 156 TaxID=3417574 RepID=UPI003D337AA1